MHGARHDLRERAPCQGALGQPPDEGSPSGWTGVSAGPTLGRQTAPMTECSIVHISTIIHTRIIVHSPAYLGEAKLAPPVFSGVESGTSAQTPHKSRLGRSVTRTASHLVRGIVGWLQKKIELTRS